MIVVILSLFFLCVLFFYFYAILAQFQSKDLPFDSKSRVLLLTAHPDDECMFFGPTLTALHSLKSQVHVLCLSTGNAEGLGSLRKKELVKSCQTLGISASRVKCVDHPSLKDSMQIYWDPTIISDHIKSYVEKEKINTIITFDNYGVSGHTNHRACNLGAKQFVDGEAKDIGLYTLTSISLLRKYIGVLDLVFQDPFRLVSPPIPYLVTHKAMRQHRTQLVWFRWLYVIFSRYMFINGLSLYQQS
ncbi:putative N-acetylglucosaminyl-phosphatidylinositol deacetylase [Sporodiniella umbellata]|nr:putative N-acetylglucosaminyl-phosphatidylinositol deacetylase [Sporodiniella umbellata]